MIKVGDRVILRKTAESIFRLGYNSDPIDQKDGTVQRGTILDITDSPFTSHKLYQVEFDNGRRLWIMEEHLNLDELQRRKSKIQTILGSSDHGETKKDC